MVASERCIPLRSPVRRPIESVVDALESETQIIRNLFALEPKAQKSKMRWVLLLAVLAVAGVLALDGSVREVAMTKYAAARARVTELRHGQAPAAAPVTTVAAPAVAAPVVSPATNVVSAPVVARSAVETVTPSAVVAATPAPKKAASRRHK